MEEFQLKSWKFPSLSCKIMNDMSKIEEIYMKDVVNSVNVFWLIASVFIPLVLYYVMYKISISTDKHVEHKKSIYLAIEDGKLPEDLKEDLKLFPVDTMKYYWLFFASGMLDLIIEMFFPINLVTLYIPTPTLIALGVNFLFLVVLSDVISKRFYVHQQMEEDINHFLVENPTSVRIFKKRSGLSFMILSFVTFGIYIYLYLFLITREYRLHIMADYSNMRRLVK